MRPRGPLPPRVYWTRRLVLLVVVVLLATFVWWLAGGSGSANEAGTPTANGGVRTSSAPTTPTGTEPTTPSTDPRVRYSHAPSKTAADPSKAPDEQAKKPKQTEPTRTPLAEPTGDCKPDDVGMKIDIGDSAPGRPNTATLLVRSTGTPACTLSITPDTMVVRITSGQDVVWSSDECPDALRAQQVVARQDPPAAYQFRWDGRRSSENCQPVDAVPQPGGYWVEAAMVGGEPHRAYFDIKATKQG